MPESIIQLPADSTGKKVHTFQRTIGANAIEDEVVLLGENYLAGYTVTTPIAGISLGTVASHLVQVMAGATLKVRIRRIVFYQTVAATAAANFQVGLYRLTTAGTGGTVVTPSLLDPSDVASGATAMTLPTVKGTEGALLDYFAPLVWQTAPAAGANVPFAMFDFESLRSKPLIIAAGVANGIAVKAISSIPGASASLVVYLDESNF